MFPTKFRQKYNLSSNFVVLQCFIIQPNLLLLSVIATFYGLFSLDKMNAKNACNNLSLELL